MPDPSAEPRGAGGGVAESRPGPREGGAGASRGLPPRGRIVVAPVGGASASEPTSENGTVAADIHQTIWKTSPRNGVLHRNPTHGWGFRHPQGWA